MMSLLTPTKKHGNIQNEIENLRNKKRMEGWDIKNSRGYKVLCNLYGPKPNQRELKCLAQVVACHLSIRLDREAARRKKVLIKWYDENIDEIEKFLKGSVLLLDAYGNAIGNDPRNSLQ